MTEVALKAVESVIHTRECVRAYSTLFKQGWVALSDKRFSERQAEQIKKSLTGLAAPLALQNAAANKNAEPDKNNSTSFSLTQTLLAARSRLINPSLMSATQEQSKPADGEWLLALLALDEQWRNPWLNLMAARCREAGAMSDTDVLVKLVSELGEAAQWVTPILQTANDLKTSPSPLAELERELIGHSLDENAAIPSLVRILREAFLLVQLQQQNLNSIEPIKTIDGSSKAFSDNWCAGRLLALPSMASEPSTLKACSENTPQLILQSLPKSPDAHAGVDTGNSVETTFDYLNRQPWAMLLSLVIFTQDAWAAEQRGGLLLECQAGQNAYAPNAIQVLVQGSEGDEVAIGSLADMLLALFDDIGMGFYPYTPDALDLSQQLSPLMGELLNRQLWQYRDGSSGRLGYYQIHPTFSDACYSLPLSPLFGRKSKALQHSIKTCALQLREAKLLLAASATKNTKTHSELNTINTGAAHGF
ncbi:hypothetical protein MO867_02260 [Microbulbifer sp. OS29]|uniref:Uncharacterized protein n=1 Tax=Microbulbifer okhotskensis TaxID=2926617 RepID=A0A9X2ELC9_9GAMM|nr:hypothetical protein [Microbulbifer okhotskensis]MCO1333155.1 hypothetical protein [Microbulbifer okhotskensis]